MQGRAGRWQLFGLAGRAIQDLDDLWQRGAADRPGPVDSQNHAAKFIMITPAKLSRCRDEWCICHRSAFRRTVMNLTKKLHPEISVRHEVVGWIPSVELILFHVGASTISKFGWLEPTKTKCMQAWISLGPNHRFWSLPTPTQAPVPASSLSPTSAGAGPSFAVPVRMLVSRCWCLCWFRGDYAGAGAGFAVL
jgi:hypothetical protein